MVNFFIKLYHFLQQRKFLFIGFLFILFLTLGYIATKLKFEEDITKLIPNSHKSEITNKVLQHVNFADKIIVYLEAKNNAGEDDLAEYAAAFIDSLENYKGNYIRKFKVELPMMK